MSARLDANRFAQLHDQKRTSTGYTHAPGGVLRLPPGWGQCSRALMLDVIYVPIPKRRKKPGRKPRGDL